MPLVMLLFFYSGRKLFALALGAAAGLYFFGRGLLLLRRTPAILSTSLSGEGAQHQSAGPPEVIQLSPLAATPSSSIEMTSQARIAAALSRAGMPSPSAWAASPSIHSAAGAAPAKAEPAHPGIEGEVIEPVTWKIGLMICGGPALTLTCFYLLAVELGWL